MNLVDSSGWISFFANTKNARKFEKPILDIGRLLVPTIVMYEVFKVMLREKGGESAVIAQAHMQQATVADLTPELAVSAAEISITLRIPMADSIIRATAKANDAIIWTQDEHFKRMNGVNFFPA